MAYIMGFWKSSAITLILSLFLVCIHIVNAFSSASSSSSLPRIRIPAPINTAPSDYLITSLPNMSPQDSSTLTHHSGYINIDQSSGSNIFFYHVQSAVLPSTAPLIIWLSGGPGCSSMFAAMAEIGPILVSNDSASRNPNSWHNVGNLLFIDSPVGTGFSYSSNASGRVHTLEELAADLHTFLQQFLSIFIQYQNRPIYLSGESIAAKYVLVLAQYILDRNSVSAHRIPLAGLLITNPDISPVDQLKGNIAVAYSLGIIEQRQKDALDHQYLSTCRPNMLHGNFEGHNGCDIIEFGILAASGNGTTYRIDPYDTRRVYSSAAPNANNTPNVFSVAIDTLSAYFNRTDVKQALHADTNISWTPCSSQPSRDLRSAQDISVSYLLPNLLKQMPVLLAAGQYDMLCNNIGINYMIDNLLQWNGLNQWATAKRMVWNTRNNGSLQPAGYSRYAANLTLLVVIGGSHATPLNEPYNALDMVTRFVNKKSFGDAEQGLPMLLPGQINPSLADDGWFISLPTMCAFVIGIITTLTFQHCWYSGNKRIIYQPLKMESAVDDL